MRAVRDLRAPLRRGFALVLWLASAAAFAQPADIAGRWLVRDPETKKNAAIIEITTHGDRGSGTLAEPFDTPKTDRCKGCQGALHNAPMWGLPLLDDLHVEDGEWHGRILDPDSGRYYRLDLKASGDELYITARALFGLVRHHETWHRVH